MNLNPPARQNVIYMPLDHAQSCHVKLPNSVTPLSQTTLTRHALVHTRRGSGSDGAASPQRAAAATAAVPPAGAVIIIPVCDRDLLRARRRHIVLLLL